MLKKVALTMASFMLFASSCLHAEVQLVTIKWTQYLCYDDCVRLLEKQFAQVKGVSQVAINQAGAQAEIRWKPNVPFSYVDLDNAMRMVGPSIEDIRIKVHGTLSHTNYTVTLTSTGDNTRFQLLSPIIASTTQYVEENSVASHTLWASTRTQLLQAEQNKLAVTVEGQLFQPEQAPPLYIVIGNLSVDKPKQEGRR